MADHRPPELSYGHPGHAQYDRKKKKWLFNRWGIQKDQIRLLWSNQIPGSASRLFQSPDSQAPKAAREQLGSLLLFNPQVAPAYALLKTLIPSPEDESIETLDFAPSKLLAFGLATKIEKHELGTQQFPIIAVAAGEARDVLRLIRVRREHLDWKDENCTLEVDSFTARGDEEVRWAADHGRILQICSYECDGKLGRFIAVRRARSTTIFFPLYSQGLPKTIVPINSTPMTALPAPKLKANPAVTISSTQLSGHQICDVAFNPRNESQIAMIDVQGNWRIWTLSALAQDSTSRYHAQSLCHFIISEAAKELPEFREYLFNQIVWLETENTVLICTRRIVYLYDTSTYTPLMLRSLDLNLENSTHQILHMQRNPLNGDQVFALTSSRIYWLSASGKKRKGKSSQKSAKKSYDSLKIVLSWRHFQNPDITNRCLSVVGCKEYARVILFSAPSQILIEYQCAVDSKGRPVLRSDASIIQIPSENPPPDHMDKTHFKQRRRICGIHFTGSIYSHCLETLDLKTDLGQTHKSELLRAIFIHNDLSLTTALYTWHMDRGIGPPIRTRGSDRPGNSTRKLGEFKVRDEGDQSNTAIFDYRVKQLRENLGSPAWRYMTSSKAPALRRKIFMWSKFHSQIFNIKVSSTFKGFCAQDFATHPFALPSAIFGHLMRNKKLGTGISSLLELATHGVTVATGPSLPSELMATLSESQDFDDDSSDMDEKSVTALALPWTFPSLVDHRALENPRLSLAQCLEWTTTYWLHPLPKGSSQANRLNMENVTNFVALQLYLSLIGLHFKEKTTTNVPISTSLDDSRAPEQLTLSLRTRDRTPLQKEKVISSPNAGLPVKGSKQAISLASSQSEQLPRSSPPLAAVPAVSSSPTRNDPPVEIAPEVLRLRNYISMGSQENLPPAMSNILAHWTLGTDPSRYDWESTRLKLLEPDSENNTVAKRLQRRKRNKKRGRTDTVSQPKAPADRLWGSSPGPSVAPLVVSGSGDGSSRALDTPREVFASTQEEKGVFGSRNPRKTLLPKKKRKAGF